MLHFCLFFGIMGMEIENYAKKVHHIGIKILIFEKRTNKKKCMKT